MARYKEYDYTQGKFIPVYFNKQILPGTFEHTLHYLIDNEIDMTIFDKRYQNDKTGAPAYDPAILLKMGGSGFDMLRAQQRVRPSNG